MTRRPLRAIALLIASSAFSGLATAAQPERNFGVTSFERVRVDGPYKVRLTTGIAPFARASGSQAALDSVAIEMQGSTLVVRPRRSSWGGYSGQSTGPVEISLGTHELNRAWLNGAGSLAINQVRGLSFDLSVQGSGVASIGRVAVDQLNVALAGSGGATIAGTAAKLTAVVRGASSLDATALAAKDATIGAEGPATVAAAVSGTAKIEAAGAAAVTLSGRPACTVRLSGSASVSGCK